MTDFAKKRAFGPTPRYPLVEKYRRIDFDPIFIAGPCFTEDEDMIKRVAENVAKAGATHLRGGVFRAGTYPPENFGLAEEKILKAHQKAAHANGLKNIMEVLDYSFGTIEMFNAYADCLQIGSRGMQHYSLLKKVASFGKQTFLKRNQGSNIDEWLGACEYLLKENHNCHPVLIERGSSGFASHVRWDLSVSIIPAVQQLTEVPVVIDAAHGTGRRDLVEPMTLAGVAAGADGCLVEVHPDPDNSLSDPEQAITPISYRHLIKKVTKIMEVR